MKDQFQQQIESLRLRATRGGVDTVERCEQALRRSLTRIVRRVVRSGHSRCGLTVEILREARNVNSTCPHLGREEIVQEVTGRLCSRLVGRGFENWLETSQGVESTAVVA